jgi:hypothetical protein
MHDGRNRIPSLAEVNEILDAPGPAKMPTPYLEMLFSRARDMMEHERLWYIANTITIRSQLAQLESQAAAARAALGPAEEQREKSRAEITEEDLRARHAAEELRSESFIRMRREAEREARIAGAESNYLRVLGQVHAIEVQITQVRDTVQSRLSIARMRALRISAYLSARTATYWEGLVHAHRDGRHLAPLLPHLIPRLPLWVVPEEGDSPEAMPLAQPLTGTSPPQSTRDDGGVTPAAPRTWADETTTPQPTTSATVASRAPHIAAGGRDGEAPQEQPVPAHRQ